uniref:Uncharacterized protein n=1 Tax=Chelonoidis abingdonii TaxID=106734 RepID=A0A8C0HBX7_CHEAB
MWPRVKVSWYGTVLCTSKNPHWSHPALIKMLLQQCFNIPVPFASPVGSPDGRVRTGRAADGGGGMGSDLKAEKSACTNTEGGRG